MNITVCGGGNVAHSIIGSNLNPLYKISLLTRHPEKWEHEIHCNFLGTPRIGKLHKISNNPEDVIPDADIVIITVPSFAVESILLKIKPYLALNSIIGKIPGTGGFEKIVNTVFTDNIGFFGLQRVPYICRTIKYGQSVNVSGIKDCLYYADNGCVNANKVLHILFDLFNTKIIDLKNYLYISLTPSNPILHPSRLYGLFSTWEKSIVYDKIPKFYEDWDDYSSEVLITCDKEIEQLFKALNLHNMKTLREHYESFSVKEMTKKIKSINAFKGIETQMIKTSKGFIPDFNSRYFTEDVPFGLSLLIEYAKNFNIDCPMMIQIETWAKNHIYGE